MFKRALNFSKLYKIAVIFMPGGYSDKFARNPKIGKILEEKGYL